MGNSNGNLTSPIWWRFFIAPTDTISAISYNETSKYKGDEIMCKNLTRSAISGLLSHYYQEDDIVFRIILDSICDQESWFYILEDLHKVSRTLIELEATFLIEYFELYDAKAAMELKKMVAR